MLGKNVEMEGKKIRSRRVIKSMTKKVIAPLKISSSLIISLTVPFTAYTLMPTGGVIIPIPHILTAMMANHMGSYPKAVITEKDG